MKNDIDLAIKSESGRQLTVLTDAIKFDIDLGNLTYCTYRLTNIANYL